MNLKMYNPKSHAPSVYIPCWLIQISNKKLSARAKILYGRIAQWSNSNGVVHRSVEQLSKEVGSSKSGLERSLKELKDFGLIATYHPIDGGVNYYQFFDHPVMHEKINESLEYKNNDFNPPSKMTAPPVKNDGGVPSKMTVGTVKNDGPKYKLNKKEIKENNKSSLTLENNACDSKISDDGDDIFKNNYYQEYEIQQSKNEAIENIDEVKTTKPSTFEPFIAENSKPKSMTELTNSFLGVARKNYKAEMQRLPQEWENISYSCLDSIGFSRQEITKLFKKDPLPPEAIQRSIISFSEQLKNPDAKKYADPLGVLVGTLMTGAEWKYQNLDVPKKEIALETLKRYNNIESEKEKDERIKKENAERIEKINRPRRESCQKWYDSLDEKGKLVVPKSMCSHLEGIRKAEIFKYYEENIENNS